MGQPITVQSQVVGNVALYDTDRSITGQDGEGFAAAADSEGVAGLPAQLAARIHSADDAISYVFVHSNSVSVERDGGWDQGLVDAVGEIINKFFVFYRDDAEVADAPD